MNTIIRAGKVRTKKNIGVTISKSIVPINKTFLLLLILFASLIQKKIEDYYYIFVSESLAFRSL
jgi:hypothetical protein